MEVNKYSKCVKCGAIVNSLNYKIILENTRNNIIKKAYLCSACFYELLYSTKPTKIF